MDSNNSVYYKYYFKRVTCESLIKYLHEVACWWFLSADLHHYNYEIMKYVILVPAGDQWKQHNLQVHSTWKRNRIEWLTNHLKNISDHTMYRSAQWKRVSTKNLLQSKTGITEQKKAGKALCISKVLYLHWNKKKIIKKNNKQNLALK